MTVYMMGAKKGGVGKSTVAVNLAALLALHKRDVLLLDTDESGDASGWFGLRPETGVPPVHCVRVTEKVSAVVRDASRRYEDIVIDAGGRESTLMYQGMTVANVLIMPTLASQFDLWQVARIAALLDEARGYNERLVAYALVNRASNNWASKEAAEAAELITEFPQLRPLQCTLREREAYRKAARQGRAVFEIEGEGARKAADDFWAFAAEIGAAPAPEHDQHGSGAEPVPVPNHNGSGTGTVLEPKCNQNGASTIVVPERCQLGAE
jgi:chromosome partitioning protein